MIHLLTDGATVLHTRPIHVERCFHLRLHLHAHRYRARGTGGAALPRARPLPRIGSRIADPHDHELLGMIAPRPTRGGTAIRPRRDPADVHTAVEQAKRYTPLRLPGLTAVSYGLCRRHKRARYRPTDEDNLGNQSGLKWMSNYLRTETAYFLSHDIVCSSSAAGPVFVGSRPIENGGGMGFLPTQRSSL